MSRTAHSAPARIRAAVVLFTLRRFDHLAEELELPDVAWIATAFRAIVEQVARQENVSLGIRSPAVMELIVRGGRSPGHASMGAILAAAQVLACWRTLEAEALRRGTPLPECNAAVHTGNFVSTNGALLGSDMELALRIAAVARDSGIFVSEATLNYMLATLPPDWEAAHEQDGRAPSLEDAVDLMTEDLLPLSTELEGRVVWVGPGVKADPGGAVLEFQYWVEVQVGGGGRQVPILRVSTSGNSASAIESAEHRTQHETVNPGTHALIARASEGDHEPIRFGHYELLSKLGAGGMGTVWLARDRFGNKVAIKQLLPGHSVAGSQMKRFQLEAEVMSRLSHRNIARIHETGEVDGAAFIAMEYVEGASLAEILYRSGGSANDLATLVDTIQKERTSGRSGSACGNAHKSGRSESREPFRDAVVLPIPQSIALMRKICDAVHFAHEHGVLHRDLKPHNIMIRPDGEPVIMDFGLAKLRRAQEDRVLSLSVSGQILGTIEYMAPEQTADSKRVTERADVYALGAVLYELLTGARVFSATGDLGADIVGLREHVPIRPRKLHRLVERDLETITLKALRPDPEQRYSSARSLADDLRRFDAGEPILARKQTVRYRLSKQIRRHRAGFAAAAVILVLSIAFAAQAWMNYQKQWGRWVKIYERDFTAAGATLRDFETSDALGIDPAVVAPPESDGLHLEALSHYWLKDVRVAGSVRVVAEVEISDPSGNVGIFLNTKPDLLAWKTLDSRGYSAWFNYAALDVICAHRQVPGNRLATAAPTRLTAGRTQRLIFERDREKLSLSLNGQICAEWVELLPLQGGDFDRIGIRSWGDKVRLRSLAVYRLALPESSSPLAAGDALMEAGHQEDAVRRYKGIAEDFRGQPIAPLALAKAYLTAAEIVGTGGKPSRVLRSMHEVKRDIRTEIERDYPDFAYRHLLAEADALLDWKGSVVEQDKALAALDRIVRERPESQIVPRMLSHPSATRVPELLTWVTKFPSLTTLNLTGKNLTSIESLRGARLQALQLLQNPKIASLEPLRGMPLRALEINGNSLLDIEPLRGMPLESFLLSSGEVRDLSPLRGTPLKQLRVTNLKVEDFEPLRGMPLVLLNAEYMPFLRSLDFVRGMPLRQLVLKACPVGDLEVLRGLPLANVDIENCEILDLSPLAESPIVSLACRGAQINDIAALRGMPLRKLDISRNRISSLKALSGLALRRLSCGTNQITSLEPLRGMRLDFLDCQNNPITSLDPFIDKPPADFLFASDTLPASEYERAIAAWSGNPDWTRNTRRAEIALAVRRGDRHGLRRLATLIDGRRYLHVEQPLPWTKAREACERLGGHLLTLTSKGEADAVFAQGVGRGWLGIVKPGHQTQWQWLSGEAYKFHEWSGNHTGTDPFQRAGVITPEGRSWHMQNTEHGAIRPFTIEWED